MTLFESIAGYKNIFCRRKSWHKDHAVYVTRTLDNKILGKPCNLKTEKIIYALSCRQEKLIPQADADDWEVIPELIILKTISNFKP